MASRSARKTRRYAQKVGVNDNSSGVLYLFFRFYVKKREHYALYNTLAAKVTVQKSDKNKYF